jgi:hypothetical protein
VRVKAPDGKPWVRGRGDDRLCVGCGHYQGGDDVAECDCKAQGCRCKASQWTREYPS